MSDDEVDSTLDDEEMDYVSSIPMLSYLGMKPVAHPEPGAYFVEPAPTSSRWSSVPQT